MKAQTFVDRDRGSLVESLGVGGFEIGYNAYRTNHPRAL